MTIERIRFPEGYPLNTRGNLDEQKKDLIALHRSSCRVLPEGNYDLTPPNATDDSMVYELTVFSQGTGIFRARPRVGSPHSLGGIVRFPEDGRLLDVSLVSEDESIQTVYDIVIFTPGESPK